MMHIDEKNPKERHTSPTPHQKTPSSPGHVPPKTTASKENFGQQSKRFFNKHRSAILGWGMIIGGGFCLFFFRGIVRNLLEMLPHLFAFVAGLALIFFGLKQLKCTKITNTISKAMRSLKRMLFGNGNN